MSEAVRRTEPVGTMQIVNSPEPTRLIAWLMFLLGVVCGWIVLSLVGVPVLAWLLAALHRDEVNQLRVALEDFLVAEQACKLAATGAASIQTGKALDEARERARAASAALSYNVDTRHRRKQCQH